MTVKEFVEEYNKATNKTALVGKHIKTDYLPYEQKIALAKSIVNATMYQEIDNTKKFVFNTPAMYLMTIRAVIEQYTDLEWTDPENILEEFNLLERYMITEEVINKTNGDYTRFATVLNMVKDDRIDLERSLVSFFDNKIDALGLALDTISK